MGIRSKREMCDLVMQVLTDSPGETCEQINMKRTIRGEQELNVSPDTIFTEVGVSWFLGFTFSDYVSGDYEYKKALTTCFRRGWFDFMVKSRALEQILTGFISELITWDNEMYATIADRFLVKFPKSNIARELFRITYATGRTSLSLTDLIKMKHGLT